MDQAWRIAFQAKPKHLTCTQLIYLGINAHLNNDLAFMIEDMGARYLFCPDHKHVNDRQGPRDERWCMTGSTDSLAHATR